MCAKDSSYAKSIKFCTLLGFFDNAFNAIDNELLSEESSIASLAEISSYI